MPSNLTVYSGSTEPFSAVASQKQYCATRQILPFEANLSGLRVTRLLLRIEIFLYERDELPVLVSARKLPGFARNWM